MNPMSPTGAPMPPQQPIVIDSQRAVVKAQVANGAGWWTWIAGITVINSVIELFGGSFHFVLGTGITELVNAFATDGGGTTSTKAVALVVDLVIAGLIFFWGILCARGARWAFITGMVLYGIDTILVLVFKDWLSAAFHAYALFRIGVGAAASFQLAKLDAIARQNQDAPPYAYSPSYTNPPANPQWPPTPAPAQPDLSPQDDTTVQPQTHAWQPGVGYAQPQQPPAPPPSSNAPTQEPPFT